MGAALPCSTAGAAPAALIAVLAHRYRKAADALNEARAVFEQAVGEVVSHGLSVDAIDRALALSKADPRALEMRDRETAAYARALRVPGVEFQIVEVRERLLDEDHGVRLRRIADAGYHAAVANAALDSDYAPSTEEHAAWVQGVRDFNGDRQALQPGKARRPLSRGT